MTESTISNVDEKNNHFRAEPLQVCPLLLHRDYHVANAPRNDTPAALPATHLSLRVLPLKDVAISIPRSLFGRGIGVLTIIPSILVGGRETFSSYPLSLDGRGLG